MCFVHNYSNYRILQPVLRITILQQNIAVIYLVVIAIKSINAAWEVDWNRTEVVHSNVNFFYAVWSFK